MNTSPSQSAESFVNSWQTKQKKTNEKPKYFQCQTYFVLFMKFVPDNSRRAIAWPFLKSNYVCLSHLPFSSICHSFRPYSQCRRFNECCHHNQTTTPPLPLCHHLYHQPCPSSWQPRLVFPMMIIADGKTATRLLLKY